MHTTCYILRKHTLKSRRGLGMKEEGSMSVYCEGESIVLCVPFSLSHFPFPLSPAGSACVSPPIIVRGRRRRRRRGEGRKFH